MSAACIARRVEGISHGVLRRYQTPRRFRHLRAVAVCWESTFVELTAVFEHVFRDFAQIEVEIAVVSRHFSVDLREGIHHPKLHILHIGRIEVRSLETAHHTAPTLRRIQQSAVAVQRRIEVVRAAFVGVESQIEHRQRGRVLVVQTLVGIEVARIDFAHTGVGQLLQVVFDIARRERRTAACEQRIDHIPSQQRTVVAITHIVCQLRFGKHRWRGRNRPLLGHRNVDVRFRILKVIEIRGIALRTGVAAGDELCKFCCEIDVRRRGAMHKREAVHEIGQPLALRFPRHVQSPNGVVQRFAAHGYLRGERLLAEVHERTAHLQLFGEIVLEIETEHRFALHAIVCVRFHRARNGCARIEDALIQNLHCAGIVVHRVVRSLRQQLSAGAHHHTPLRNAGGVELNFVRLRGLKLTRDTEFVVFGNLFRHGVCRIVEFCVGKSARQCRVADLFRQVSAERFDHREKDTSRSGVHGVALHKVEVTVRHAARVVVQTVEPHHREEALVLHRREGEIREVNTGGVGQVFHIERKAFALHVRCAERIHIAHHQRPVALTRCAGRVFQALHQERTCVVFQVGREFAHLIVFALVGVLKGYGQHLVRLQSRAQ